MLRGAPFLIFSIIGGLCAAPDTLNALQAARLDTVSSRFFVQRCCLSTLRECAKKSECPIGRRLEEFAKWRCSADSVTSRILDQLDKRYQGFVDRKKFFIDTAHAAWVGNPAAPVAIAAYVSASCGMCKHVVGALYDSIAFGGLKNKARMMAKPIGSGFDNRALLAAQAEGKFWKMFLAMKGVKTRFTEDILVRCADSIGIAPVRFRELLNSPKTAQMLDSCNSEAGRNGVQVTPTLFINGKRYASFKDARWVVDAALYETDPR
jgi:predicted DsbA family dithiol-disulfide isomerase